MNSTIILHGDHKLFEEDAKDLQPVIYPIVTSSTYRIRDLDKLESERYTYSRSDNPTRHLLERNMAILESASYGLTFSSGLGALTCISKLDIAKDGIIASKDLYGGTRRYLDKVSERFISYVNFNQLAETCLDELLKSTQVKLIWLETPSNPLLEILNIELISRVCKKYDKYLCVDNTFLSPIFQSPLELGADIVVHSVTKYINGMSDVIMGAVMLNNQDIYTNLKYLQNAMGVIPSAFDCYLVNRSIKTLDLRMRRHEQNALSIAKLLTKHPLIKKVIYPGLTDHPQKEIIETQMKGTGGMISFYLNGDLNFTKKFLNRLQLIPIAESLGGVESLVEHPATMTHSSIDIDIREELGITDNLVRLSVGLEDYLDIYQDIHTSLSGSKL